MGAESSDIKAAEQNPSASQIQKISVYKKN